MINVRAATLDDAKQIAGIHDQTWKSTYEPLIAEKDLKRVMNIEHRTIMWETTLSSSKVKQYVYVAEDERGEIVGFISGGKERTDNFDYEAEIYDIYVLEEFQGQKIGYKLFKKFVTQCLSDGYYSLLVWILTNNPYGDFYVKYGAKKVEAENVTIGDGTYEETAYGWNNIEFLAEELMVTSK
ncbi:GNAT family N-acetyltransferase [Filobacillus milosensis]|uniref:GNAT family N-acetyltransferase n=1 Tax=Filobacillus milosensis TaxID=94137 RepID=A0A4Y8IP03_9BACI|nr:GNAT family N-acetyltransferase [Filobacillus milosensis]TFB22114.1 GNAT family N-acetyltransferase [Filobacillus milosensis]